MLLRFDNTEMRHRLRSRADYSERPVCKSCQLAVLRPNRGYGSVVALSGSSATRMLAPSSKGTPRFPIRPSTVVIGSQNCLHSAFTTHIVCSAPSPRAGGGVGFAARASLRSGSAVLLPPRCRRLPCALGSLLGGKAASCCLATLAAQGGHILSDCAGDLLRHRKLA